MQFVLYDKLFLVFPRLDILYLRNASYITPYHSSSGLLIYTNAEVRKCSGMNRKLKRMFLTSCKRTSSNGTDNPSDPLDQTTEAICVRDFNPAFQLFFPYRRDLFETITRLRFTFMFAFDPISTWNSIRGKMYIDAKKRPLKARKFDSGIFIFNIDIFEGGTNANLIPFAKIIYRPLFPDSK